MQIPFVPFESRARGLPGESIASVPQRSLSGIANESNPMGRDVKTTVFRVAVALPGIPLRYFILSLSLSKFQRTNRTAGETINI